MDESGTYSLGYNQFGHPSSLGYTPSARARADASNVATTYSATYNYSHTGVLKTVSLGGLSKAAAVTYGRDDFGRATSVTSTVDASATTLAEAWYDVEDRVTFARYGNGTNLWRTFNALNGNLDRVVYGGSQVLAGVSYQYDANGNVLQENREATGGWYGSWKHHAFDGLDRLVASSMVMPSNGWTESYGSSPGGRLITAGGDAYTYASPASSQAVSLVENAASGTSRALAYDADGMLETDATTRAGGDSSSRAVSYDAVGCVKAIVHEDLDAVGMTLGTARTNYTCGLDGKLVARDSLKMDGSRSRRIDFAGLAEIRPDEGIFLLRVPVHGAVAVEDARSLTTGDRVPSLSGYVVSDVRGSVLATLPFDGSTPVTGVAREAEFDPWGKALASYSAMSSPRHGFAGAEMDPAAGTYSFGARVYDPTLRRWLSPDPLLAALPGLDEALGDNLNLYAYAGNNPIARVDLTGYWGEGLKEHLTRGLGLAVGVAQGFVPFGMATAPMVDNVWKGNDTFRQANGAGQVIGGAAAIVTGGTTMAGGTGLTVGTAGAGAIVGVPALVVGAAQVANGTLAMASGADKVGSGSTGGVEGPGTPQPTTQKQDVVTANGQKATPNGTRLGPSGKPEFHYSNSATRKQAVDGAKAQGGGATAKDGATGKQPAHWHSVKQNGERVSGPNKTHFNVRGDKPTP